MQKTFDFFLSFIILVILIVLNQFLPLVLSWLTIGCLLRKVNKPPRNLRVPAQIWDLTSHWWKMLITMEGPTPKLKDTKSSTVIHQVFAEFCSGRNRQNFNEICAGLCCFLNQCDVWLYAYFSRHCICCTYAGSEKCSQPLRTVVSLSGHSSRTC